MIGRENRLQELNASDKRRRIMRIESVIIISDAL